MNNKLLIAIIVVVVLGIGGFLFLSGKYATAPTSVENTPKTKTQESVSDSVTVEAASFAFNPQTIKVKAGGTISFTNKDSTNHSFTADDGKSFDSGVIGNNQTKTVTAPGEPGEYPFHCTLHPNMTGTLVVE